MNFKYYKLSALIPFLLVLSIFFTWLSNLCKAYFSSNDLLSRSIEYINVFSTIGLITLTITFINFWGWKFKAFKWLIDIPNLNGRYKGELISSFIENNVQVKKLCVMEIKQTASSIHIYSYFGDFAPIASNSSSSQSVSEQLVKENNGLFKLYFIFSNESEPLQTQLTNHLGTAKFKYFPDIKSLSGDYYNQRMNFGTIKVDYEQKKILGRLTI